MIFMTYNSPNCGIYGDIVRVRLDRGSMLSLALVCLSLNFCPTFLFLFFAYDIGKLYSKYDYVGAYVCVCVCVCVCSNVVMCVVWTQMTLAGNKVIQTAQY